MARKRVDILLVERGLVDSRQRAQRIIRAGLVIGPDRLLDKPEPCELDKCDCLGENVCIEGGVDGPKTTGERVQGVGER